MIKFCLCFLLLFAGAKLHAQWIVHDPANTAINAGIQTAQAANHLEVLKQWTDQLAALREQIRQLEAQLQEQRRIREVLGNPTAAGGRLILDHLGQDELARQYGDTLRQVRRLAEVTASLRRSADGVYQELEERTLLGQAFTRQTKPYQRHAAVDRQAEQTATIYAETLAAQTKLQTDLGAVLDRVSGASTQAEVDKLAVNTNAINGQLLHLVSKRRDQAEALQVQQIENENQRAKEQLDRLEKQLHEERRSTDVVNAWQQQVKLSAAFGSEQ